MQVAKSITRQEFLKHSGVVLGAVTLGNACTSPLAAPQKEQLFAPAQSMRVKRFPEDWALITSLSYIDPNQGTLISHTSDEQIAIHQIRRMFYQALKDKMVFPDFLKTVVDHDAPLPLEEVHRLLAQDDGLKGHLEGHTLSRFFEHDVPEATQLLASKRQVWLKHDAWGCVRHIMQRHIILAKNIGMNAYRRIFDASKQYLALTPRALFPAERQKFGDIATGFEDAMRTTHDPDVLMKLYAEVIGAGRAGDSRIMSGEFGAEHQNAWGTLKYGIR
jgi:hypothetical protein